MLDPEKLSKSAGLWSQAGSAPFVKDVADSTIQSLKHPTLQDQIWSVSHFEKTWTCK